MITNLFLWLEGMFEIYIDVGTFFLAAEEIRQTSCSAPNVQQKITVTENSLRVETKWASLRCVNLSTYQRHSPYTPSF